MKSHIKTVYCSCLKNSRHSSLLPAGNVSQAKQATYIELVYGVGLSMVEWISVPFEILLLFEVAKLKRPKPL